MLEGLAALSFPQFLSYHMTVNNYSVSPSSGWKPAFGMPGLNFLICGMGIMFLSYRVERLTERQCVATTLG